MKTFDNKITTIRSGFGAVALFTVAAASAWGLVCSTALAPEPVQMKSSLTMGYGPAFGTAIKAELPPTTKPNVVMWTDQLISGGNDIPAGTPCFDRPVLPEDRSYMHIVIYGSRRACRYTKSYSKSVIGFEPIQGMAFWWGRGVEVDIKEVKVVRWPWYWTMETPQPAVGMACSTTDLAVGETTKMHIQLWQPDPNWSRCVDNGQPLYTSTN